MRMFGDDRIILTMSASDPIPTLAFSQRRAIQFRDADSMSEALARGSSLVMNHRPLEPDGFFCAHSAVIKTRNIRLVALASSAFVLEAKDAPKGILMLPVCGFTVTRRESRTFEWGAGKSALYLPPGGCSAQSTARSVVGLDVDPTAFDRVMLAMLGGQSPPRTTAFSFARPLPVELMRNRIDFGKAILSLIATLDSFEGDETLIERSGIDDAILRTVALLLNFEQLSDAAVDAKVPRAMVQLACEYIDANLTNPISLTDLEFLTGLSRRSLQYGFRAAFDCTPMQWVAQRRLEAVRRQILEAPPGANLTMIAGEYFANLGEFARMYRRRYGELPSATLKQALAKRLRS